MKDKTHISIRHINKMYHDGTKILNDINLEINEGEILVLLGSSGCGKSTLLRTIAGLEEKTSGEIYFYNQEITGVPVEKRNIGFVFQNYALFPTMTVRENISFGLKLQKLSKEIINNRVKELVHMMNLQELLDKKPMHLSGGQQQRVAIARVLAIKPKVLLMDEPLTALDAKLKERLRIELGKMLRKLGITTIYVTHDQREAMAIADRIAIVNKGVIEQIDTPENIYLSPKSAYTAQFIGKINALKGTIKSEKEKDSVDLGFIKIPYTGIETMKDGSEINVFIRPEDIHLVTKGKKDDFKVKVTIEQLVFMGGFYQIEASLGNQNIFFEVPNTIALKEKEEIEITFDMNKIIMV